MQRPRTPAMGKCQLCDAKTQGPATLCVDCEVLRAEIKARGRDMVIQTVRTTLPDADRAPPPPRDARPSFSAVRPTMYR